MAKLRWERRARIDWENPNRTATAVPPSLRIASSADRERLSYRNFPKQGESVSFSPDLTP